MKKWVKRIGVGFGILSLVVLVVGLSLLHLVDFTVSSERIQQTFAALSYEPHFGTYEVAGRSIHYVEVGDPDKPVVLFVHGSPGSWDGFLDFLANPQLLDDFRMIAVDRPGFGKSGLGKHEPSLAEQAAVLGEVLAMRSPEEPAILVGHSYGAPVVARLAMDRPERVRSLVLVAGSVDPALEKTKWFQIPADWLLLSWALPPALVASNREILALKDELEAMMPLWEHVTHAVTIIQGEVDRLVPPGNADFAERMLTRAPVNMVRVPDMNHFVPWSHPQLIVEALMDFARTEEATR